MQNSWDESFEPISIDDASACLQLTRQQLYRKLKEDDVPIFKINRRSYIQKKYIMEWFRDYLYKVREREFTYVYHAKKFFPAHFEYLNKVGKFDESI